MGIGGVMAGGLLRALYSGTRGLDLGPTKMRNDESFRQKQLMEDMRRALAGEKIQASELALRESSLDQQRDLEMKRQALEQQLAQQRMQSDQSKNELERGALLGAIDGQPTLERQKLTAAQMTDTPPWQKGMAEARIMFEALQKGYRATVGPNGQWQFEKIQPEQKAPVVPGAGTGEEPTKTLGQKIGQSIWEFDKWFKERFRSDDKPRFPGTGKAGDDLPPAEFEGTKQRTEEMRAAFLAEKEEEAAALSDAQLKRLWGDTSDKDIKAILKAEAARRGLFDPIRNRWND